MEIITHSREETVAAGREFAKTLPGGALIAFTGGLGAGKTAFCQGLAEGLGCTDPVSSPTFAIVNYYRGPVFPVNTVGFACALNTLDGSLCNLVLFAEFRNFTGQHCTAVFQFRRSILSAHLLNDFRPPLSWVPCLLLALA